MSNEIVLQITRGPDPDGLSDGGPSMMLATPETALGVNLWWLLDLIRHSREFSINGEVWERRKSEQEILSEAGRIAVARRVKPPYSGGRKPGSRNLKSRKKLEPNPDQR